MRHLTRAAPLGAALLMLSGCATTEGFGRDVETAGGAIRRSAEEAQPSIPEPTAITPVQ